MFYRCLMFWGGVKYTLLYYIFPRLLLWPNKFPSGFYGALWSLQMRAPLKTTIELNSSGIMLCLWHRQHKWRNHQLYGVNFILGNDILSVLKWTSDVNDKCVCLANKLSRSRVEWESKKESEDTAKQIDLTRCRFTEQTVESRPGNSEADRRNAHTRTSSPQKYTSASKELYSLMNMHTHKNICPQQNGKTREALCHR